MKQQSEFKVMRPGRPMVTDNIAEEVPVALEYNGISHAVMLATPVDLEDFALGFSLSEGIVNRPGELYDIEVEETREGIVMRLEVAAEAFFKLKQRRRTLTGRTGCGLCGTESLSQVTRDLPAVNSSASLSFNALLEAVTRLPAEQWLQQATGAVHAACHISADGAINHVREDVGRHNALDKTLGSLARQQQVKDGGLLVTSRASFEMVQKTAALGYSLLAAVSAPTAAAVRLAESLNLTLIGFLRGDDCVLYTHGSNLTLDYPHSITDRGYSLMEKIA
ncbi:MAG: formate dehydrogenase accessory sulfurtransferase FdhD [Candidatus Thiodiazotropha sp. 6PLUC1]